MPCASEAMWAAINVSPAPVTRVTMTAGSVGDDVTCGAFGGGVTSVGDQHTVRAAFEQTSSAFG